MRNYCKSFGGNLSVCKRVAALALTLAVGLLCGGAPVLAADAAKSGKTVRWKLAEDSFYGSAKEFRGKRIEPGDGIISADKERIFGEYFASIYMWNGAARARNFDEAGEQR